MLPKEAIKTVWPHGNPNMSIERIEASVPKVQSKLAKYGFTVACHGSYHHMAMEIIADERSLKVTHKKSNDIVTLSAQ